MKPALSLSFIERLQRSRLLTQEQIQQTIAAVGENDKALAEYLVAQKWLTPFQARQLRAGATSLTVGKYAVVDLLGRGGHGLVFKARHRLLPDRHVTLKTVDTRNLHFTQEVLARFKREIEIVGRLDHPNVVRALDVVPTRTQFYLVLEYVPGQDLGQVVKERGPLPIPEAVDYIVQAARGLAYAHGLGIVHRDLKPTNLLLTPDGVVKLADLGLARFFTQEQDAGLTQKGLAMGTPEFMAPEQATDASSVGPLSDLYSLGATLFHLLTADSPVAGSTYLHKLQQLLTMKPRSLAEVRPDAPPGLIAVVDRLRAREPADRPRSAEEAVALLEPFLGSSLSKSGVKTRGELLGQLVLRVLRGQITPTTACGHLGISQAELDAATRRFIEGGLAALK